jgi:hypothetical protein
MTHDGTSKAFCSFGGWPALRSQPDPCGSDLEAHTLRLLQIGNDLKQIASGRIPVRTKPLIKSLCVNFGMRCQLREANCSIDVVTQ